MSKYIDAEKLKELIDEKWKELADKNVKIGGGKWDAEISTYLSVLRLIDSIQQEQPGVDLEEYIENEIKHYGLSLYEASYGTFSASQIDRIIRNAFELGLNAIKEE